jgi:hypothetical protein
MASHKNLTSDLNKIRGFVHIDSLGIGASIVCLVHCALLPFLLPFFSTYVSHVPLNSFNDRASKIDVVEHHASHAHSLVHDVSDLVSNPNGFESLFPLLEIGLHLLLFPALFLIALFALVRGFRHHRKISVIALGSGGVILLLCGLLLEGSSLTLLNFNFFRLTPDILATIMGSVFLLLAHLKNLKACTCPSVICGSSFAHSSTSKVTCCSSD